MARSLYFPHRNPRDHRGKAGSLDRRVPQPADAL